MYLASRDQTATSRSGFKDLIEILRKALILSPI